MNKFSSLEYLQNLVARKCEALPESFKTREEWEKYRKYLRNVLFEILPVYPPSNPKPSYSVMKSDLSENLVFESVAVNFDSDYFISVNVYKPKIFNGKLPVMLVCPGYEQPKNTLSIVDFCISLAKAGIMAVTLDYTGTGEAADRPDTETNLNNIAAAGNIIGINDIGLRVMSNLAVLRYLKTLKDADIEKLGITGICQGSIVLWYTAAVSDDFKAIAPLCGTTTYEAEVLEYSGRQGGWSGITPFTFNLLSHGDVQHLYGCFAPRPLFVQSNIIDIHWPHSGFEKIKNFTEGIYSLYNASENQQFLLENEPHAYSGVFITNIINWFHNIL